VLLGKIGHVRRLPSGRSQAFIDGAWWTVRSAGPELADDDAVRVVDLDGLDVVVESVEDVATDSEGLERHG
jgi:membrane protein implicated in regulation of membrane protease activity